MSKGSKRRPEDYNKVSQEWDRIFGKKEQDELKESYEQSKRNKKERTESEKLQEELEPIDKETEKFLDDIANNTPNVDQFKDKK